VIELPKTGRECTDLFERGFPARDRSSRVADVGRRLRGREAQRTGIQGLPRDLLHLRDFRLGRLSLGRLFAHHEQTQRGVAEQGREVDRHAASLDGIEVLGKGLEPPVVPDTLPQGVVRHPFDVLEGPQDQLAMRLAGGRDSETTIPHHDRCHAMPGRDGEHAVPHHLGVVVGMDVDEARRHHTIRGVDLAICTAADRSQRGNASIANADVPGTSRRTRSVYQCSAAYQQIEVFRHENSQPTRSGFRDYDSSRSLQLLL